MPQYYTPPTTNDTKGLLELSQYTNTISDGLVFPAIIMVIWVVVFIATKQFNTSRAFTYASFVATILSIPLAVLDMVSPRYMYLFGLCLAGGIVWLKLEGGGKPF